MKWLVQGYTKSDSLEAVGWRVSWSRLEQPGPFLMQRIEPQCPTYFSFSYLNVYSVSGTVLTALHIVTHLMLTTAL